MFIKNILKMPGITTVDGLDLVGIGKDAATNVVHEKPPASSD